MFDLLGRRGLAIDLINLALGLYSYWKGGERKTRRLLKMHVLLNGL